MAIIIALVTAVLIAAFQLTDLASLLDALEAAPIANMLVLGSLIFELLLRPWSLAMASIYTPLAALGVAGFIAGLVSKSRTRMLPVSVFALVLFFLAYLLLSVGGGFTDFSAMLSEVQSMVIDIGIAWGLLFIPGIIGASLTAEG
jgi:hypothetical protein